MSSYRGDYKIGIEVSVCEQSGILTNREPHLLIDPEINHQLNPPLWLPGARLVPHRPEQLASVNI